MPTTRKTALLARTIPFALFMAFIAVDEGARNLAAHDWPTLPKIALYYLYPFKVSSVAVLLYLYRREYREFSVRDLTKDSNRTAVVFITGILTCVLWVSMDWNLPLTVPSGGFNPMLLPAGPVRIVMTMFRVAGAVLVVPLMEELFWRSFMLRYLIDADFESVPLGRFTWISFLVSMLLFGLEHQLFLAGMMAGAVYNIILYKTRSLAQCVLAHAVTNLALACYVLYTGKWYFW